MIDTRRARTIAGFGLSQLLWSPRTLGMGAVALSPVLAALVFRAAVALELAPSAAGFRVFSVLTATLGFPFIVPMLSLFYASGVTSDEVEAGTMTYFLNRPVKRAELLAGKMLASFTMTLALFLLPFLLSYYVSVAPGGLSKIGAGFPTLLREVFAAFAGVFAYNGLFALAGTALRRPLLAGLFFVFGWQAGASIVPGSARYLTVTHYLSSLLPRESVGGGLESLLGQRVSPPEALVALALIGLASHAAAIAVFRTKEY